MCCNDREMSKLEFLWLLLQNIYELMSGVPASTVSALAGYTQTNDDDTVKVKT